MELSEERFTNLVSAVERAIYQSLYEAWQKNQIPAYLKQIGLPELIPQDSSFSWNDTNKAGKIIIFGESSIKERDIIGVLKRLHIEKDRVELHLGYKELKRYPFTTLQYNHNYRLILVGPLPHSVTGKEDFSSIITMMENTDGYTKVVRLCSNQQLKITKSNLRNTVREQIASGYLAA